MVLEEAKILDKFIMITDTAAREAVQGYENSIIVDNNEESIYNVLKEIIEGKIKCNVGNKSNSYENSVILDELKAII